ncbi:MAG: cobaltochelatase subunit CobN [Magnetospiraceae bacterium]
MHLLAATPGAVSDGTEAVDLNQTPGDILFLSAADTELSCLAAARPDGGPSLRLASLLHLAHPLSVDLYVENTLPGAKLVIVRLLGGRGYWDHGVEQLIQACAARGILLALLPGDDQPDAELARLCTVPPEAAHRLWQYCVQGGVANMANLLAYAADMLGRETPWLEPKPLVRAGLYWPGLGEPMLETLRAHWLPEAPIAAIVFYRALVQAGNLAPVDALIDRLRHQGVNALPIHVASLKDPVAADILRALLAAAPPSVILNATGFAVSTPGAPQTDGPFAAADCPVLQVVFSGGARAAWESQTNGLSARDIAMNVALPEVDGRILSRAVSFKGAARRDEACQIDLSRYEPAPDRIDFVAALAANWARLRETPVAARRLLLILANYPNKEGRLGNGVGLDTPAGTVTILRAFAAAGYDVRDIPEDGNALIDRLAAGPTNDLTALPSKVISEKFSLEAYKIYFNSLSDFLRKAVESRWGPPQDNPYVSAGGDGFALPVFYCGSVAIALQPARGYNVDPTATYHDPDLVPPHDYLAFYAWARQQFQAHAVIHMGKHGNLEWLPGKSVALSRNCFPEVALGPMPHLYPFIVNDPGEGTQAKRRAQAVIIDHLTPPLARAESYGPLRDLERLVDEYYEAAGVDPRRLKVLERQILDLSRVIGLDVDCGIDTKDDSSTALGKLDNHLCELKELQIRDGLHVFGESPSADLLNALLVALARVPRGAGKGAEASLHRALAQDLGLGFDPLDCVLADPWDGPRPTVLTGSDRWRSTGDTVERLEALALDLISGQRAADPTWDRTTPVLAWVNGPLRQSVEQCGVAERQGLLTGLNGRFVAPGPSGAPSRGRPDVLPTGRNFYSVDTRSVPTPAAWTLGWKSASMLIERYVQDQGDWPRAMALTAWGTSNMRTGGDDIAQALALIGARPTWDSVSGRVTGFEILPVTVLGRPRVDVTLRISGFFRDAFPGLVDLFDSAARAVADIQEPDDQNPLALHVGQEAVTLLKQGLDPETARFRAGHRVFGSKPGAYGAGLQALMDERGWETEADLARAYVAWGGYAYGGGVGGSASHGLFETRLKSVQAVVQNQDNREHDILDSDDYYQFEGGMTAAARVLSGAQPAVYHNDHSRPETPKVRRLEEEMARIVRGRAANPKWIAGVMRHGYKGAFEMAATVDYLFAFAATAACVADHHFDLVFDAYLGNDDVRAFIKENNPTALGEMADRFAEAIDRGLWHPRANSTHALLEALRP